MALADHPRAHVFSVQKNAGQRTAVVVLATCVNIHRPTHEPRGKGFARSLATGLADLRRVDTVDTQFDRHSTVSRTYPQAVTVCDADNFCLPGPYRTSATSYQNNSN